LDLTDVIKNQRNTRFGNIQRLTSKIYIFLPSSKEFRYRSISFSIL